MSFAIGNANIDRACTPIHGQKNIELERLCSQIMQRLEQLEKTAKVQAVDPGKGRVAAPPPQARLKVQFVGGTNYMVMIANPEFISPVQRGNPQRSPIYHRVAYSPMGDFSSDVVTFEPSHQTHFAVVGPVNQKLHFSLESSYDGTRWNQKQTRGPF